MSIMPKTPIMTSTAPVCRYRNRYFTEVSNTLIYIQSDPIRKHWTDTNLHNCMGKLYAIAMPIAYGNSTSTNGALRLKSRFLMVMAASYVLTCSDGQEVS